MTKDIAYGPVIRFQIIGLAGLWLAFYLRQLKSRPLLPAGDPELEEVFAHE
jgi:hypothetical protein